MLSCVRLFATPQTVACQAALSVDFPGKNIGVGSHALQRIFLTQGWNSGLLHCKQVLYCLSHMGGPYDTNEPIYETEIDS